MNASRQDYRRAVDYSAVDNGVEKLANCIQGLLSRRQPQRKSQIEKWFHATPKEFIDKAIDAALENGRIEIRRNGLTQRAGYVYALGSPMGGYIK